MSSRAAGPFALGVTGASGAIYALRTMAALLERGCRLEIVFSEFGRRLLADEIGADAKVDRLQDLLVARYGEGVRHYATLAFADPFMRLLQLTPALRTTIVMDIGRTFPLLSEEEADAYLATADGVFVSLCERRTLANNDAAFQVVFGRAFEKKPLNECWDFYRRKPA